MPDTREFDLILWGATGFTGRLTAEYLAGRAETQGLKWALGGRNEGKLQKLAQELTAQWPHLEGLPVVVGDAGDAASMRELAGRTRVVVSLVGPFGRHGSELVAACADLGTHYCDSTGEPQWVRKMIDLHHARARETGARIVHCCGFDSIPSDLGVWMLADYAQEHFGSRCDEITFYVFGGGFGLSGGTLDSMMLTAEQLTSDRQVAKVFMDPYSLNPADARGTARTQESLLPSHDRKRNLWTAPFLMAAINTRVVRRSNALLGHSYGAGLRYEERMPTGSGARGFLTASLVSGALAAAMPALMLGPVRRLLQRFVLPKPGEGPSDEARAKASFKIHLYGHTDDGSLALTATVAADGDPGYGETAKMMGESGLCLALDPLRCEGGILTPASAMAAPLIARLRAAGHTYSVEVDSASQSRLAQHTRRQQAQSITN